MNQEAVQPAPTGDPLHHARWRAAVVAMVAGPLLIAWFVVTSRLGPVEPATPPTPGDDAYYLDYFVDNIDPLRWSATLFTIQWVIVLVLVVAVVRAVARRIGLTALLAMALATAATAVYVVAEGMQSWPVVRGDITDDWLRAALDPAVARALVESRDGLHAPAAVLLGCSVLAIGLLLVRSDLWARALMAVISFASGALALTSIVVGPDGLGPGLIFLVWGLVVPALLLVALRRADRTARDST